MWSIKGGHLWLQTKYWHSLCWNEDHQVAWVFCSVLSVDLLHFLWMLCQCTLWYKTSGSYPVLCRNHWHKWRHMLLFLGCSPYTSSVWKRCNCSSKNVCQSAFWKKHFTCDPTNEGWWISVYSIVHFSSFCTFHLLQPVCAGDMNDPFPQTVLYDCRNMSLESGCWCCSSVDAALAFPLQELYINHAVMMTMLSELMWSINECSMSSIFWCCIVSVL